jgi:hypothetical protein
MYDYSRYTITHTSSTTGIGKQLLCSLTVCVCWLDVTILTDIWKKETGGIVVETLREALRYERRLDTKARKRRDMCRTPNNNMTPTLTPTSQSIRSKALRTIRMGLATAHDIIMNIVVKSEDLEIVILTWLRTTRENESHVLDILCNVLERCTRAEDDVLRLLTEKINRRIVMIVLKRFIHNASCICHAYAVSRRRQRHSNHKNQRVQQPRLPKPKSGGSSSSCPPRIVITEHVYVIYKHITRFVLHSSSLNLLLLFRYEFTFGDDMLRDEEEGGEYPSRAAVVCGVRRVGNGTLWKEDDEISRIIGVAHFSILSKDEMKDRVRKLASFLRSDGSVAEENICVLMPKHETSSVLSLSRMVLAGIRTNWPLSSLCSLIARWWSDECCGIVLTRTRNSSSSSSSTSSTSDFEILNALTNELTRRCKNNENDNEIILNTMFDLCEVEIYSLKMVQHCISTVSDLYNNVTKFEKVEFDMEWDNTSEVLKDEDSESDWDESSGEEDSNNRISLHSLLQHRTLRLCALYVLSQDSSPPSKRKKTLHGLVQYVMSL